MEDLKKQIEEEKEQLSQKIRNWGGSEALYIDMKRCLERLRFKFDQLTISNGNVEAEENIDT
tara:strand:+ start:2595 stop:2780 length:186 start_codon:yes stop_codon:yes gene_type:complete